MEQNIVIHITVQELRDVIREEVKMALQTQNSTTNPANEDRGMTIFEAAQFTKIPIKTLYQYVSQRKIPHFKPGRIILFNKNDLIQWMETHRRK